MPFEILPRSCDRCHAMKERCQIAPGSVRCDRCNRLNVACRNDRPKGRPGRRPKPNDNIPHSESHGTTKRPRARQQRQRQGPVSSMPANIYLLGDASEEEIWMMNRVTANDDYVSAFVLGPSFCAKHRETTVAHFFTARSLMKDAYIACALLWDHESASSPPKMTWVSNNRIYQRATTAICNLRSFQVTSDDDIATCLVLAGVILSISSRLPGSRPSVIAKTALEMIKPAYVSKTSYCGGGGFLTCVTSFDTFESLFRGEVPKLRLRFSENAPVDRVLGLCTSILPIFYDLCRLCKDMSDEKSAVNNDLLARLTSLEDTVRRWKPIVPTTLIDDFNNVEVSHMLCQARVLQDAALLILHRLRHPFGTEVAMGMSIASGILTQLDMTKAVTGRDPFGTDMALFTACVEIPAEARRRLSMFPDSPSSNLSKAILFLSNSDPPASKGKLWHEVGEIISSKC